MSVRERPRNSSPPRTASGRAQFGSQAVLRKVAFPTASPFLLRDATRDGAPAPTITGAGELYLPRGEGPHPAVVVIEGLGGLKTVRERAYGAFLAESGYVALVVDSFGPRGAGKLRDDLRALVVTEAMMMADGYAALRFLRAHPAVDPERVFVIGFSYGAMISVLLAYEQIRQALAEGDERFAGHVSYYGCSVPRVERPETTGKPILIMLGELDRNVSIERSKAIADDLRRGGSSVELDILKDVNHQWDGSDVERRFVRFNLRNCAVRIDKRYDAFDERSGFRLRGPISRALLLMMRASPEGYYILKDEAATRRSDRRLLDFLARHAR